MAFMVFRLVLERFLTRCWECFMPEVYHKQKKYLTGYDQILFIDCRIFKNIEMD